MRLCRAIAIGRHRFLAMRKLIVTQLDYDLTPVAGLALVGHHLKRLAPVFNVDMALTKVFRLPGEGKRLQFRAEAFNAFNHPNFTNPSLSLESPQTFGEFQGTMSPRSMQFALRWEF